MLDELSEGSGPFQAWVGAVGYRLEGGLSAGTGCAGRGILGSHSCFCGACEAPADEYGGLADGGWLSILELASGSRLRGCEGFWLGSDIVVVSGSCKLECDVVGCTTMFGFEIVR